MAAGQGNYPAKLDVDYVAGHDRLSSFFRIIWSIPILIVLSALTASGKAEHWNEASEHVSSSGGGIMAGLFAATLLMILFRHTEEIFLVSCVVA